MSAIFLTEGETRATGVGALTVGGVMAMALGEEIIGDGDAVEAGVTVGQVGGARQHCCYVIWWQLPP